MTEAVNDNECVLPVSMQEIAELIGVKNAIALMDNIGGLEKYYIPKNPKIEHELAKIIGLDNLVKLSEQFGGDEISFPKGSFRDLKKSRIFDAKGSARAIAKRLGVTQRYVRKVRNLNANDNQGDLFSEA